MVAINQNSQKKFSFTFWLHFLLEIISDQGIDWRGSGIYEPKNIKKRLPDSKEGYMAKMFFLASQK